MTTASEAKDFAIIMGYEAMRICTHGTTKKHDATTVLRWMRLMLKQQQNERTDSKKARGK